MNKINTCCIAATLVLGLAGCSDDSKTLGSVYIKTGLIPAATGGSVSVTQQDCAADSAKCAYVGTSIVVPRGALSRDEEITILPGEDATGRDGKINGPAVDFGPDGTAFNSPVEITVPVANDIEKDLLRVYVTQADGTKSVLMPYQLAYDPAAKQVRFLVSHFTTFQCGEGNGGCSDVPGCNSDDCENGACNDACDPSECGPQPGIPSWPCDDGSAGGFTGACERNDDGSCGWVINNCNPGCGGVSCPPGSSCDPTTNSCVNDCVCPDGQPCAIDSNGIVYCGGGNGCDPATPCPDGSVCDPNTGMCGAGCVCPDGQACVIDPNGTISCGNQGCGANGVTCPPGSSCDPATGTCTNDCTCPDGQPCAIDPAGNVFCGGTGCDPNTPCPPGSTCDPATGQCVGDCTCPDNTPCTTDPNGTVSCTPPPVCDPTQCGPQPGLPNWPCDDGTVGGPTGNCVPNENGACGWEIIWCDPACDSNACDNTPPPPPSTCPDGTIPPYVCGHDANGACAWVASCGSNPGGN